MARQIRSQVRQTSNVVGTGAYTLDGTVDGHLTFASQITNGATVPYGAFFGTDFELGIGTYNSAGSGTIERTRIRISSNSNAAVVWPAGEKNLFINAQPDDVLSPWERQDTTTGNAGGDMAIWDATNEFWTDQPVGVDRGFGGVPNYPVASTAEAEAGVATNRLMTPKTTKEAIGTLGSAGVGAQVPVSGYWMRTSGGFAKPSNSTLKNTTADALVAQPIILPYQKSIDRIGIQADALGGQVRFGIYGDSGGFPGDLLWESSGAVNVLAGLTTANVGGASGISFAAGRYHVAFVANGLLTMVGLDAEDVGLHYGISDLAIAATPSTSLHRTHTFGALPASFGTPSIGLNSVFSLGVRFVG